MSDRKYNKDCLCGDNEMCNKCSHMYNRTYPKGPKVSDNNEIKIGPCCKRDKKIWIGVGVSISFILLFFGFYLNLITLPPVKGSLILFYVGHIIWLFVIIMLSLFSFVSIRSYCRDMKDGTESIWQLVIGLICGTISVILVGLFFNFLIHDYYDAMLYDTDTTQRMQIINSLDCRTYQQFYHKDTGYFIHENRINYDGKNDWSMNDLGLCGLP